MNIDTCLMASEEVKKRFDENKPDKRLAHFSYGRRYLDNTRVCIGNNPLQMLDYYQNALFKDGNTETEPSLIQPGLYLTHTLKNQEIVDYHAQHFSEHFGIYFIFRYSMRTDIFYLASDVNSPEILNLYLNRKYDLIVWLREFVCSIKKLINACEHSRIFLPASKISKLVSTDSTNIILDHPAVDKLTQKEIICASFLLHAMSNKQMAINLNVSEKAIEKHIASIKDKCQQVSRSRLISYLRQDFMQY